MTTATSSQINPKLDLVLERVVDVSPEQVWAAWTQPEHIKHWFAPSPWSVSDVKLDLRVGGQFAITMRSPEGQDMPGNGCILELVENRKLVWTDALTEGFRPSGQAFMTGMILIEPHANGTKYTAIAKHLNEETRKQHEDMGFQQGWSQCLDQLVAYMKSV